MNKLVCRGARFSYFLLLIFAVPIVCEADYILYLWLKTVPEYAPIFLRLILFGTLMAILGNTMLTAIQATGNIRRYQIWITIAGCFVFPLTWIAYKLGFPPETTYIIYIIIYFLLNFIRVYIAKGLMDFPVRLYLFDVIFRVVIVSIVAFIFPLLVIRYFEPGFLRLCISCIAGLISSLLTINILGLEHVEREMIYKKVSHLLSKLKFSK